jgi:hypothetical protein
MRQFWFAAVALAAGFSEIGLALAQPVASQPNFVVGDFWEFNKVGPSGDKTGELSRKIIAISADGIVQMQSETGRIIEFNRSLNAIWKHDPKNIRLFERYPMKVGDHWDYTAELDNESAPGIEQKGSVKIVSYESITVPAGTFDCYRMEAEISVTYKLFWEHRFVTRWYCPAIKWMAKQREEVHFYFPFSGGWQPAQFAGLDLTKFTAGE